MRRRSQASVSDQTLLKRARGRPRMLVLARSLVSGAVPVCYRPYYYFWRKSLFYKDFAIEMLYENNKACYLLLAFFAIVNALLYLL